MLKSKSIFIAAFLLVISNTVFAQTGNKVESVKLYVNDQPYPLNSPVIHSAILPPPSFIDASDYPNDSGGRVLIRIGPAPSHPVYKVGFYEVLAGDDIENLTLIAVIALTPKIGDTELQYAIPTNFLEKDINNFWARSVATTANGRIVSDVTGPNKSIAVRNCPDSDFDCSGTVDITDLALFATFFGNASEYEPYFDLNTDGVINIIDLAIFADKFGTVFRKKK